MFSSILNYHLDLFGLQCIIYYKARIVERVKEVAITGVPSVINSSLQIIRDIWPLYHS